ncbi:MAG: sulfatase family protein [Acidimicrobiia bacterium]
MRVSRSVVGISVLCAVGIVAASCSSGGGSTTSSSSSSVGGTRAGKPNIVFVLTDDLDLTSYTSNPKRFPQFHRLLAQQGTTFTNAFVTDSLCCPSRASILRGQYVHDHGVQDNLPPNGGFEHWQQLGRDTSTVATWLHAAGYRTALFGKYLNGYPHTVAPTYVPPGWDDWASPSGGNPYAEYNYQLNENGTIQRYGADPSSYLVDVLAKKSDDFIARHAGKQPFFMYVAPYVPHQPATPAPRYVNSFPDVSSPRPPSYDQPDVAAEPAYVRDRPSLSPAVQRFDDRLYRRRLQSMLGVEDLLAGIVKSLQRTHQLDNTYIVFTSDNGFHLGEHRLPFGKQTPYETDIHVPLVVRGPGVPAGRKVTAMAREIDLAPTFATWAHASTPAFVDGQSLASLLTAKPSGAAPRDALVEHYATGDASSRAARKGDVVDEPDDDVNPPTAGTPTRGGGQALKALKRAIRGTVAVAVPPYRALRTPRYMYAEYITGEKQLFDVVEDPYELHNLAATAAPALLARLSSRLQQLATCSGASCRR